MGKKIIVEGRTTQNNSQGAIAAHVTVGLYVKGRKIVFNHIIEAVDAADNWTAEGTFPIKNYNDGIKELIEKGSCLIKGSDLPEGMCEELKLKKVSDNLIGINYSVLGKGASVSIRCNVNMLVLKKNRRKRNPTTRFSTK